ncbi:MAG TPA: efflux RND transporter periplasmic adaptor subunit [Steroidobacteraceae bacterium]|nr:efflux RND transporter periplasmic adaptor subunit [Steroidobacteraceae bacterium]
MTTNKTPGLLLAASLLAACGAKAPPPPPPPAPEVAVVTLAPRQVELSTVLPGRTSAYRIAEVRPQVDGIVLRRLFNEGAEVRAGEPLYEIDPAPYRAALLRAEAALASAEAQFEAARLISERYGRLQAQGVVSKQEYDNAVAADKSGAAAVASAKAALETARIDLTYTQVRAPISGRIGRSVVTEGALVTRNQTQPLATVAQLDPIYVDVTQSSTELLRLQREFDAGRLQRDGQQKARVMLQLEDGTDYPQPGTLQFSEVTVEAGTGSVLLRAVFPNPQRTLLPGMFVRATLPQGSSSQALVVPQAGVSRNARGEPTVLVVDAENKLSERVIQVSRAVGSDWLVSGGLDAGERVVVDGLQRVRAGITVTPLAAEGK